MEHMPKNKIIKREMPKHLLTSNTATAHVVQGPKGKKKKLTMLEDSVRKPKKSVSSEESDAGHDCVAKRYGLHEVKPTAYEKRMFKHKMADTMRARDKGMSHDVLEEVLDEYMALSGMQGNHGQQKGH